MGQAPGERPKVKINYITAFSLTSSFLKAQTGNRCAAQLALATNHRADDSRMKVCRGDFRLRKMHHMLEQISHDQSRVVTLLPEYGIRYTRTDWGVGVHLGRSSV